MPLRRNKEDKTMSETVSEKTTPTNSDAEKKTEEKKKKDVPAEGEIRQDDVDIFVERPQSANDDPNLFVSVGGKNYLLPKGEYSRVPREVAHEIMRAQAAQQAMDKRSRAMVESASRQARSVGVAL